MRALAIVSALAACGHHGNGPRDGGDGGNGGDGGDALFDAAIDVPNVQGSVTVHVVNPTAAAGTTTNGLVCETGQHVIFIDTDATQTDVTTDGNGDAQGNVFPGASVTVICHRLSTSAPPAIAYMMVTIQAIEPGDHLVVNAGAMLTGRQTADVTPAGSFTVTFAARPGADNYAIYGPCGADQVAGSPATLTMTAGCVTSTMDIVAVALNGSTPIAYASQPNVTYTSGGNVAIADAWHAMATVTETVSNAPAFCANPADPDYPCAFLATRIVPALHGLPTFATASPSAAVSSALAPTAKMQTLITTNATPHQIITQNVDGTLATYALDLGATLLPWLCLGNIVCPGFDATNARITTNVVGTGAIDLFQADATYVRANTTIFIWRVFGPTPGDVQLPHLPVADGDVTPKTGDKMSTTHAFVGESDAIGGWRPARLNVFDSLETCLQPTTATSQRYGGTLNRFSRSN